MGFSPIIVKLMIIDYLSVFLFGFGYPSVFVRGKVFLLLPFLSYILPFLLL